MPSVVFNAQGKSACGTCKVRERINIFSKEISVSGSETYFTWGTRRSKLGTLY